MKPAILFVAALSFFGCAGMRLTPGSEARGEVVDAVGTALFDGEHLKETQRKSLADAMRSAVERVVGVEVSARTMTEKTALIDSRILARSKGYILKYEILGGWTELPFYKTKIRALVSLRGVAKDMQASGILEEPQVANPRVAVLLAETAPGSNLAPSYASDALGGELSAKGFRVVARADLMAAQAAAVQDAVAKGDLSRMASLGKTLDADILVFGSAAGTRVQARALGGLISIRAALSAKAYQAQTGETLASVDQAASGLDVSEPAAEMKAFASAGRQAADDLVPQILDALRRAAFASVSVEGLRSLDDLKKIENSISAVPGAGDLYLRSYVEGAARMDVSIKGISTQDLASAIEKTSGLRLRVQAVTAQTVSVAVQ